MVSGPASCTRQHERAEDVQPLGCHATQLQACASRLQVRHEPGRTTRRLAFVGYRGFSQSCCQGCAWPAQLAGWNLGQMSSARASWTSPSRSRRASWSAGLMPVSCLSSASLQGQASSAPWGRPPAQRSRWQTQSPGPSPLRAHPWPARSPVAAPCSSRLGWQAGQPQLRGCTRAGACAELAHLVPW